MIQSGVVGRIFEKQWQNKKFYSFTLNGVDGTFGYGVKRPPNPGTTVKFNDKTNPKGYPEVDGSIEILADGQAQAAGSIAQVAKASTTSSAGASAYWDRKEARDLANDAARELGATRNTALQIIDLGLRNEMFKLPAAAKREEFLFTLLDKYTKKLMGRDEKVEQMVALANTDTVTSDGVDAELNDTWN